MPESGGEAMGRLAGTIHNLGVNIIPVMDHDP